MSKVMRVYVSCVFLLFRTFPIFYVAFACSFQTFINFITYGTTLPGNQ